MEVKIWGTMITFLRSSYWQKYLILATFDKYLKEQKISYLHGRSKRWLKNMEKIF
jgi:hypothetical protein